MAETANAALRAEYEALSEKIRYYNDKYEAGESEISDYEYDQMMLRLKEMEREHPALAETDSPTKTVGAAVKREAGVTVTHRVPMLSIQDVFTKEEVTAWADEVRGLHPDARFLGCTAAGNPAADVAASEIEERGADGIAYLWRSPQAAFRVRCPLPGRYSVMNTMEAAAVSVLFGADPEQIRDALAGFRGVPGRLERVPVSDPEAPRVFIDYAHTPDALGQVTRILAGSGSLTVVFGCGGERDRAKRPRMAEAAQRYASYVVVTEDNPRRENPDAIFRDILTGLDPGKPWVMIPDRREAIRHALAVTGKGGVVLLAGKGHETYQIIGTQKRHFDEREIVSEVFKLMETIEK